jgi:hypothetical protein
MHTIRLRGPWEHQTLEGGLVRYTRRFHRPTGLEGGERVWLIVDGRAADVSLNGQPLAGARCDVTPLLAPSNHLAIIITPVASTDALARLEMDPSASSRLDIPAGTPYDQ